MNNEYGDIIRSYRMKQGLSQSQVAKQLDVTPGYISNVENGHTAMSLRMLIYYAKIMGVSLDSLVGNIEPEYRTDSVDNEIMKILSEMDLETKKKLLETMKIWNGQTTS